MSKIRPGMGLSLPEPPFFSISSRKMAKELPVELIMEILSWLPVKSLLRFRSVSKPWLQLLTTNSQFIKLHLQRISKLNNNHPGMVALKLQNEGNFPLVLYYAQDCVLMDEAKKFELPSDKSFSFIFGVYNGLICLVNHDEEHLYNRSDSDICIWNPLIGDHITLPSSISVGPKFGIVFGFGFNQSDNEHKVVRIVTSTSCNFLSHVEIYTLGMDSWRRLEDISYGIGSFSSSIALVNGAIHWYGDKAAGGSVIIAFDVKDGTFREVPRPRGVDYNLCNVETGELGGLLCMFGEIEVFEVQIWVMKEYGVVESWTEEFKIERTDVLGHISFLQPLGVTRDGEIILKKDNSEVIFYNPNMGTCKVPRGFASLCYDPNTYIGSLVSPKSFIVHSEEI